jgi:hypothetical protein
MLWALASTTAMARSAQHRYAELEPPLSGVKSLLQRPFQPPLSRVNSRPTFTTRDRGVFTTHDRVMFTTHVRVMFTT